MPVPRTAPPTRHPPPRRAWSVPSPPVAGSTTPRTPKAPRGSDGILSGPIDLEGSRHRPVFPPVSAELGLVATHADSGLTGKVTGCTETAVRLRDAGGTERIFTRAAGAFIVDGERVALIPGVARARKKVVTTITASGSISTGPTAARVARGSRIWVEGIHDAELVEKVWGDDLRAEGVVVEQLEGADELADRVREFAPSTDRRLGILLDHLIDGTKEQHIAREAVAVGGAHVLVRGHRFVDIWQAIKPATVGLAAWPVVPKGEPWKEGICTAIGWPGTTRELWVKLLRSVKTYRDLEPSLLASVEELIDFVAPPPTDD